MWPSGCGDAHVISSLATFCDASSLMPTNLLLIVLALKSYPWLDTLLECVTCVAHKALGCIPSDTHRLLSIVLRKNIL